MKIVRWVLGFGLACGLAAGQAVEVTDPPAKAAVLLKVAGEGFQIYVCKQMEGGPGWSFVRPEAKLLDAASVEVGRHGAGPSWVMKDGSSVKGKVVAQRASTEADAVPWLLLDAMDAKGPGMLGGVRWIRRSATHGGKARAVGCDAGQIGLEDRVPYTATYTFFGAGGS